MAGLKKISVGFARGCGNGLSDSVLRNANEGEAEPGSAIRREESSTQTSREVVMLMLDSNKTKKNSRKG